MAPFRNRDRSNRSGRGQIEHNALEGLPIKQYRESEIAIGPNLTDDKPVDKNAWPELPMPRDSHMLPDHAQQILRAARSGRTHKPPPPPEDENEMKEEEEEHKEVQIGFTVKKYVKVPRHLEVAEPEYLAKRRKGLPSPYVNGQLAQATLRETKVKKLDSEGNVAVYKVLVPEGQAVDGEVKPTDAAIEAAPATAAPGTVVEGVGVVNAEGVVVANDVMVQTPPKRRPPPPKKKAKRAGPGRGKKKVLFADGEADQGTPASTADSDLLAVPGLKYDEGSVPPSEGDTPMGEAGADDEEGSGEDGSDDEDQDMETNSNPSTPPPMPIAPTSAPATNLADVMDVTPSEAIATPELPIATSIEVPEFMGEDASSILPMHVLNSTEQQVEPDLSTSLDGARPATPPSRHSPPSRVPTEPIEPKPAVLETEPMPIPSELEMPTVDPEPVTQAVAEPFTEPVVESIAEPVVESIAEPVIESITEPTMETVVEPIPQPITPPIELIAEPITESIAEPVAEPIPESIPESIPEPMTEPITEPMTEPMSEPIPEPIAEFIVEPIVEPPAEPIVEPNIEKIAESITTHITEPISPQLTERTIAPIPAPIVATEPEIILQPEPEPITEPAMEIDAPSKAEPEPAPAPVPLPTMEPAIEPAPETMIIPPEVPSGPPSEPDLLGSLEKHLENAIEDPAGS